MVLSEQWFLAMVLTVVFFDIKIKMEGKKKENPVGCTEEAKRLKGNIIEGLR